MQNFIIKLILLILHIHIATLHLIFHHRYFLNLCSIVMCPACQLDSSGLEKNIRKSLLLQTLQTLWVIWPSRITSNTFIPSQNLANWSYSASEAEVFSLYLLRYRYLGHHIKCLTLGTAVTSCSHIFSSLIQRNQVNDVWKSHQFFI